MNKPYNILSFFYTEMVEIARDGPAAPQHEPLNSHSVTPRHAGACARQAEAACYSRSVFLSHSIYSQKMDASCSACPFPLPALTLHVYLWDALARSLTVPRVFNRSQCTVESGAHFSNGGFFFFLFFFEGPCPGLLKRRLTVCILR